MKKIVIPIIIAAVLGIGGGVTAVMMNRSATADKNLAVPEVKTGKYYLNGDKNSDIFFELTDDYIALRINGDPVEKAKSYFADGEADDSIVTKDTKTATDDYCKENPYVISVFGTSSTPYQIMIHWNEEQSGPIYGGIGFTYNGTDKISCHPFGDFILVKE